MINLEIPSDDQVVQALGELEGRATAVALRNHLVDMGHSQSRCELAIQRAADREKIFILRDWTLSLEPEQAVA